MTRYDVLITRFDAVMSIYDVLIIRYYVLITRFDVLINRYDRPYFICSEICSVLSNLVCAVVWDLNVKLCLNTFESA